MPPVPPQPVQLNCPSCGTPFRAGVYTLVDVGQQPELKQALLGGQLNVAVCPNCSTPTMIGAPLVYHDPDKQLCLVYFPAELDSSPDEQERFVGDITSFILSDLPPEHPRGYLLTPRRFISLPTLLDTVLEGEGISREMLEQQRQRVELISQLAGELDNDEEFAALVEQHRAELTPEFFATLATFLESTPPNQPEARQALQAVYERLAEAMGFEGDLDDDFIDPGMAEVIQRLRNASDEALEMEVAELRPVIDYSFFQAWTTMIGELEQNGETDAATQMIERRSRILSIVEDMDKQAQAMFEAGTGVLREIVAAEDQRAALEANADKLDEAFLMVLAANANAAQRAGQSEMVAKFESIRQDTVDIIQSRLTPEERFINELLMAETPQASTKLLRQSVAKITPDFVKQLNELADKEEQRGNKVTHERLRQLAREAGAMLF